MIKFISITTIVIIQSLQTFSYTNYTNYGLYKTVPANNEQLEFLQSISEQFEVDFWKEPGLVNMSVQFSISQQHKESVLTAAASRKLNISVITENVQSLFDKQTVKTYLRSNIVSFDWKSYKKLDDIYKWLNDLSSLYKDILKVYSIGKSYEGRKIFCCEVKHKSGRKRSNVIIEGGIHAREWISPAFVTYMIYTVLRAPTSNNVSLKKIAELYEWYFIPTLNPDGYEYSHVNDRMWRKNLRKVDLNRNFDAEFGTVGVKNNVSSQNYPGEFAFSEEETKALRSLLNAKGKNLQYFFSIHSFGQYMLLPYEYSVEHLENFSEVQKKADRAAGIIKRRYGTQYTTGTLFDTLGYLASGSSTSWVKKQFKVPYVITFELRDDGTFGFVLPSDQILPTCIETMDGILSLLTPKISLFRKHTTPSSIRNCASRILHYNIFILLMYYLVTVNLVNYSICYLL